MMTVWSADNPEFFAGQVVGNGHCVAFVRTAGALPHTSLWRRGDRVRLMAPGDLPKGLVIATFDPDGRYGNHTDGRSHVAVLLARQDDGLLVYDQWVGHPVAQRLIRYKGGQGDAVNDGDAYAVVVTDGAAGATA
jgi:hypothetical protein